MSDVIAGERPGVMGLPVLLAVPDEVEASAELLASALADALAARDAGLVIGTLDEDELRRAQHVADVQDEHAARMRAGMVGGLPRRGGTTAARAAELVAQVEGGSVVLMVPARVRGAA